MEDNSRLTTCTFAEILQFDEQQVPGFDIKDDNTQTQNAMTLCNSVKVAQSGPPFRASCRISRSDMSGN